MEGRIMEQTEKKIRTGLTLSEVDRVNENVDFVQEVLRLVLVVNDHDYVGGPPSTGCIVAEAMNRMKKIDTIINPERSSAEG
jgi:hypothetical protein